MDKPKTRAASGKVSQQKRLVLEEKQTKVNKKISDLERSVLKLCDQKESYTKIISDLQSEIGSVNNEIKRLPKNKKKPKQNKVAKLEQQLVQRKKDLEEASKNALVANKNKNQAKKRLDKIEKKLNGEDCSTLTESE